MHADATYSEVFCITHLSKEISFVDELQLQNNRTKLTNLGVYVGKCRGNCGPCMYICKDSQSMESVVTAALILFTATHKY